LRLAESGPLQKPEPLGGRLVTVSARTNVYMVLVAASATMACPLRHFGDRGVPSIWLWAQVPSSPSTACAHRTLAALPDLYGLAADTASDHRVLTFVLGPNTAHGQVRLDSTDATGRPALVGGFTLVSLDRHSEAEEAAKRVLLAVAEECAGAQAAPEIRCEYWEHGSAERRCPTERPAAQPGIAAVGRALALLSLAWQVRR
jgi:hypothetical protein